MSRPHEVTCGTRLKCQFLGPPPRESGLEPGNVHLNTCSDGWAVVVQSHVAKSCSRVPAFPQGPQAIGGREPGTKQLSYIRLGGWGAPGRGTCRSKDTEGQRDRGTRDSAGVSSCGIRARGLCGSRATWASTLEGLEWEAEMLRAPGGLGEAAPSRSCGHRTMSPEQAQRTSGCHGNSFPAPLSWGGD